MSTRTDREQIADLARHRHGGEEIEIDPLKVTDLSFGNDGVWVRAWVFLPNDVLRANNITNPEALP